MSLPGADELFRTTGGMALQASSPRRAVPAPAGESDTAAAQGAAEHAPADSEPAEPRARAAEAEAPAPAPAKAPGAAAPTQAARRRARAANRRPSGRERHDEKITVYVSAEELMDLEHARLVLRGEHGLAVDRGRIVREAVAVVLADLESRGDASILVRRLRGR
ncbi:hypothetical protein ACFT6Z_28965 [Streptomyces sp. NPDC057131]|uniref:hypothetical protein n=2 Tax=Streptomyces TaxID=1883 RepID=UPI003638D94A